MLILYLLQAFVPLILIAWLAFSPPRSTASFLVHSTATGVTLVALRFVGIWTFPPYWGLYCFAALLLATIIYDLVRNRDQSFWPDRLTGWLSLAGFGVLSLYAANKARVAYAASALPAGRSLDLASPLGTGTYLIANGGSNVSINAHADALDQTIAAHPPYRGTGYGVDFVAIDQWGLRADGVMPSNPRRYRIYGMVVIAPCSGNVIAAVDGLPDMPVPEVDEAHLAGNHVILRCKDLDVLLGHFHKGSVRVITGQRLKTGDPIAAVGNSGSSSEPHLHIHAQLPGTVIAPFSGAPIPIRINGRYLVRNNRFVVNSDRSAQ